MNALFRCSHTGDEPGLKTLWKTVFGDDDALINAFFTKLYHPGMAALAEENGRIVAAAYAINLNYVNYIYAVATLPAYRGKGYGRAVTMLAADGRPAVLFPASPSLRGWYAREMGAAELGCAPCVLPLRGSVRRISAEEYASRREILLKNVPHAVLPAEYLAFFETDGAFYASEEGISAAGSDGRVRETLPGAGEGDFLMGLNGAPSLYLGLVLD